MDLEPVVDVDEYGVYRFIYTDEMCGTKDTVRSILTQPQIAEMLDTPAICIQDYLSSMLASFQV